MIHLRERDNFLSLTATLAVRTPVEPSSCASTDHEIEGISSEYEISSQPAWAPFQRIKLYDIPDKIFEQYNNSEVFSKMGLFADLNHAWISIDNALYIWDYTHHDPPLLGFEDQSNVITAVKMVVPRPGVFIASVSHLLIVATTAKIHVLGITTQAGPTGGSSLALYKTGMEQLTKGVDTNVIATLSAIGRISS